MRKSFVLLLTFVMLTVLSACGANGNKSFETTETKIIEAKDCFDDAGFVELIAGTKDPAEYTFTSGKSDTVEWRVYILDEVFDEGFRYIGQVAEPILVGDGTVFIDEGLYVYVYCSANEFTTGIVDENAKLNITVK